MRACNSQYFKFPIVQGKQRMWFHDLESMQFAFCIFQIKNHFSQILMFENSSMVYFQLQSYRNINDSFFCKCFVKLQHL
jgi:hypothetical protein